MWPDEEQIDMTRPPVRLNPPALWDATGNHHSQGTLIETGRLAIFSGQIAAQKDTDHVPASLREQTDIVCRNLRLCLESIGASPSDIVSLRAYIVDWTPDKAAEVFEPLVAFLGDTMPTMTGIGVSSLFSPELRIEIEMVARVPDQS
jgi:enamine deaminase RidA (YjgF/YER057c/UK114 family)